MAEAKKIDENLLEGLIFRSSEPKKVVKDGETKTRHFPTERPLAAEDVLDWKDNGSSVTIVTADGRKIVVEKKKALKKEGGQAGKEKDDDKKAGK